MVIFTYDKLARYIKFNKSSQIVQDSFDNWYRIIKTENFANLNEVKNVFNSVDFVGNDRYVFNIMGNHYRIIAIIHFNIRTVYILWVGTHKEYDKLDAASVDHKN
jgi:mRNA interferase HigB